MYQPQAGWGLGGGGQQFVQQHQVQQMQQQQMAQQRWQQQQYQMMQQQQQQWQYQQQQQQQQAYQQQAYQQRSYQPHIKDVDKALGYNANPGEGNTHSSGDPDLDRRLAEKLKAIEAKTGKQCNAEFTGSTSPQRGGGTARRNIDSDLDARLDAKLRALEEQSGNSAVGKTCGASGEEIKAGQMWFKVDDTYYLESAREKAVEMGVKVPRTPAVIKDPPSGKGNYKGSGKGYTGGSKGYGQGAAVFFDGSNKGGKGSFKGKGGGFKGRAKHPDAQGSQGAAIVDPNLSARIDARLREIEEKIEAGKEKKGDAAAETADPSAEST